MHPHNYRTIVPHARRIGQRVLTVILLVVVLLESHLSPAIWLRCCPTRSARV